MGGAIELNMQLTASIFESHKSLCTGDMGIVAHLKMTVGTLPVSFGAAATAGGL